MVNLWTASAPSWEDIQQLRSQWQELNAKEDQLRDNIDNIILGATKKQLWEMYDKLHQQEEDERAEIQGPGAGCYDR